MIFCVPLQVPGTAESARSCVRAYFADLHETLCRQEEMALSVVDAHVRERLIWLRQQQEDMTILLSQVSTACLHCEKTLQQVSSAAAPERRRREKKKQTDASGSFLRFIGRLQSGAGQAGDQLFARDAAEAAAPVHRAGRPHSAGRRHPRHLHQGTHSWTLDVLLPPGQASTFHLHCHGGVQDNRVHIGPKMEIRVVTLGLDGAGKTTILFKLKQDEFMQPIPTIGNRK